MAIDRRGPSLARAVEGDERPQQPEDHQEIDDAGHEILGIGDVKESARNIPPRRYLRTAAKNRRAAGPGVLFSRLRLAQATRHPNVAMPARWHRGNATPGEIRPCRTITIL